MATFYVRCLDTLFKYVIVYGVTNINKDRLIEKECEEELEEME